MSDSPKLPERIWLQAYGDSSPDAGPPPNVETDDVSWCWHKVFEHDVEYVLAARLAEAERLLAEAQKAALDAMSAKIDHSIDIVRDADRYRWLRGLASGRDAARIVNDAPEGMDAAIDAALRASREVGK